MIFLSPLPPPQPRSIFSFLSSRLLSPPLSSSLLFSSLQLASPLVPFHFPWKFSRFTFLPPSHPSPPSFLVFVRFCLHTHARLRPVPSFSSLRPSSSALPLEIASAFSQQYIRRNTSGYPLTGHYCYLWSSHDRRVVNAASSEHEFLSICPV